jgi:hypothetical protein
MDISIKTLHLNLMSLTCIRGNLPEVLVTAVAILTNLHSWWSICRGARQAISKTGHDSNLDILVTSWLAGCMYSWSVDQQTFSVLDVEY